MRLDPLSSSVLSIALAGLGALSCASGPSASPVTPATGPHAPADVNPFAGARLYVNPDYGKKVEELAARTPAQAAGLRKLAKLPTAIWLSKIADTKEMPRWLDDAAAQQKAEGKPVVPVFVVYDLPNRDCAAEASNGELSVDKGGEGRYQHEYIDFIAAQIAAHPDLRVALIVEPDSLANIATNLGVEKCAAAEQVYRRAIAYAVAKLSLPNAFLYLDAAHAGWLGWPKNIVKAAQIYKDVLTAAGGPDRIRGFALNVSNYDVLHDPNNHRTTPDEPSADELAYVGDLTKALAKVGITGKMFVIDTGRNGKPGVRTEPANWCNIKGAGLGERPRAAPAPKVDAYLWIKVPGESDGTADQKAARFDPNCASDDATPGAPEAGDMFEPYLVDLVKNATPPL
jgi:cellulose 1,4-beta-cellobiosidase